MSASSVVLVAEHPEILMVCMFGFSLTLAALSFAAARQ
jgi:hypothetical protein